MNRTINNAKKINFNHERLELKNLKSGVNIFIAKAGRKRFILEVDKHCGACESQVIIYPFKKDKNNNLLKYGLGYFESCFLKNNVVINKDLLIHCWERLVFINSNRDLIKYII